MVIKPQEKRTKEEEKGKKTYKIKAKGLPGGPAVKNPPSNAGNTCSIPGPGGSLMAHASQLLSP